MEPNPPTVSILFTRVRNPCEEVLGSALSVRIKSPTGDMVVAVAGDGDAGAGGGRPRPRRPPPLCIMNGGFAVGEACLGSASGGGA